MSREWTERDYQQLWLTGEVKEENHEAVTEEPGKMGYVERWVREI